MKKKIGLILCSLFLFFAGYISVKAEVVEVNQGLTPNSVEQLYDPTTYLGVSCPTVSSLKYFDVQYVDDVYIAKLKPGLTESSGSETFECTYKKKQDTTGIYAGGTLKYTLSFSFTTIPSVLNVTATISKYAPTVRVMEFVEQKNFNGIKSVDVTSGADKLNVDCPIDGTTCTFSLKEGVYNPTEGSDLVGTAVIKYKSGGQDYQINLTINMLAYYKVNAYYRGTCSFSKDWYSKGTSYEANYTGLDIILPHCENPDSAKREDFYGWVYDPENREGANIQMANVCKSYPLANGVVSEELINKGITEFYACYETPGDYIELNTSGGTFQGQESWGTPIRKNVYVIEGVDTFVLPSIISNPRPDTEDATYTFDGWVSTFDKKVHQPGEVVETNGTAYFARFTKTNKIEYHDFENGVMYNGDTQIYAISGVDFVSCRVDGGIISATPEDGGCSMKADGVGETVVYGVAADGKEYKIKMKVLSRKGTTEDDGDGDDEFVIQYEDYIGAGYGGNNEKSEEGGKTPEDDPEEKPEDEGEVSAEGSGEKLPSSSCQTYIVTQKDEDSTEWIPISNNGFGVWGDGKDANVTWFFSEEFGATCNDTGSTDKKEHAGICIDFGPPAPHGNIMKPSSEKMQGLKNMLLFALTTYKDQITQDPTSGPAPHARVAATFVSRLWTASKGSSISCPSNAKKACFNRKYIMTQMGSAVFGGTGTTLASLEGKSYTNPSTGNGGKIIYNKRDIIDMAQQMIEHVNDEAKFVEVDLEKDSVKASKPEASEGESDNFSITFEGKIKLPDDVENLKTTFKCAEGLTCEAEGESALNKSGDFKFTVKYNKKDKDKLKNKNNIKMEVEFDSYKTESSVIILIPTDGGTLQRIAIFKKEQKYIFAFKADVTNPPPGGGGDDEPTCDDLEPGSDEWMDMDCCEEITDHRDEIYQKYCKDEIVCNKSNFNKVCDPNNTETFDIYQIEEAKNAEGKEQYSGCIVDVSKPKKDNIEEARLNTDKLKDVVDNEIVIPEYQKDSSNTFKSNGNNYCRISCEEDWNFKTSAFKNFIGTPDAGGGGGAVYAGSYFQIDENLYIGGTRTCVTTFVDYNRYDDDVYILSGKIIAAWNSFAEYTIAYENLFENTKQESTEKYNIETKYVEDGAAICETFKDPFGNDITSCVQKYKLEKKERTCPIWKTKTDKNPSQGSGVQYYDPANDSKKENVTLADRDDEVVSTPGTTEETTSRSCTDYGTEPCTITPPSTTDGTCETRIGKTPVTPEEDGGESQETIFEKFINEIQYKSDNEYYVTFTDDDHQREEKYDGYDDWEVDPYKNESGLLKTLIETKRNHITIFMNELNDRADHMNVCQNFYLNNTSEDTPDNDDDNYFNGNFKNSSDENAKVQDSYGKKFAYILSKKIGNLTSDKSVEPREIKSPYHPNVRYMYEEYEYMTLIGERNRLIPYVFKNDQTLNGGTSGGQKGKEKNNWCKDIDGDFGGVKLKVCKNKITTLSYDDPDGWDPKDEDKAYPYKGEGEHKFEKPGKLDAELETKNMNLCSAGNGGYKYSEVQSDSDCVDTEFYYYKANYIKQSLENGGFYRNEGEFYVSNYSDIKVHATNIGEAASSSGSRYGEDHWTVLGGINVFPISMDTRRNIYQYMYSFGDIGIYIKDGIKLGRVMGGYKESKEDNHFQVDGSDEFISEYPTVTADHIHTCFYEVMEHICLCCGYPITTTVTFPSQVDTEGTVSGAPGVESYPKSDATTPSYSGTLGFYNSIVSLHDLDGYAGGDKLATNWQNGDKFYAYGNTYKTDKGGELAEAVVKVGENIYDRTPEYSYVLTPSAIKEIRTYNEKYGYEINVNNLIVYGITPIASNGGTGDAGATNENGYPIDRFVHYGSAFLESEISEYETDSSVNYLPSRRDVCTISAGSVNTGDGTIDIMSGSYSKCRWVDYVMQNPTLVTGDDKKEGIQGNSTFRLAFK